MGCCVSTHDGPVNSNHQVSRRRQLVSKSPPRAEEEAVKEVLFSETPNNYKPNINRTTSCPNNKRSPSGSLSPYLYTPIPKISSNNNGVEFRTTYSPTTKKLPRSTTPPKKKPTTGNIDKLSSTDQIREPHPEFSPAVLPLPTASTPEEISVSEVSEICSVSETVSTATAAEIEGEVRQRFPRSPSPAVGPGKSYRLGSFAGDSGPPRRERLTGRSPARRSDPSPRRGGPGREMTTGPLLGATRRDVGGLGCGEGQRRWEPGENSRRRSRSPATRNQPAAVAPGSRSNLGRSQSARKTGVSPGRVRMVQPGNGNRSSSGVVGRSRKEEAERGGVVGNGEAAQPEEDKWGEEPPAPNESLENPVVSLECFIFL